MSYYMTAENLYNEMKLSIADVDTSENSYIYNALFPSAMEISYALLCLDEAEKKVFASSALESGYSKYLDRRVEEYGITRKTATYAQLQVTFTGKVGTIINQGSIVSTNDNRLYKTLTDVTIGTDGTTTCYVLANKTGSAYNVKVGDISYLPIKYSGVTSVTNTELYNSAYDDETDQDLYARYLLKIQTPSTSGNVYQYKEWCLSCTGVGDAHVYPLKDENLQPKNGHVTCIIADSNKEPASNELIQTVKNYIDPNDGTGEGQAPIGATVHVLSVKPVNINIQFDVQIDTSITLDNVKSTLSNSVIKYLRDTTFNSKKVNITKIGSFILDINGVLDYSNLKLNNTTENINLSEIEVGVLGEIDIGVMN